MAHHDLKLYKEYFDDVLSKKKQFEIRFNDRNYQVDDTLTLHEGQDCLEGYAYTGRKVSAVISYMCSYGCQDGYVVLGLSRIGMIIIE